MFLNLIGPIYLVCLGLALFNCLRQFTHFTKQSKNISEIKGAKIRQSLILNLLIVLVPIVIPNMAQTNLRILAILCLPVLMANIVLSLAFYAIRQVSQARFLSFFYHTGQVCILLTCSVLSDFMGGMSGPDYLSSSEFFAISVYLTLAVVFASAIVGAIAMIFSSRKNPRPLFNLQKRDPHKHVSSNMLHHYHQAGLSNQEIETFRQEMAEAQNHILRIEDNFQKTAKMRAIELHYNILKVAKNYFKDIVAQPKRFVAASHFTLTLLPQLDDLLSKYNEINSHVAKNKQTYLILEKSAQTIDQICQEIISDYLHFHENKYQALEDGIKLADRTLKHHSSQDPINWTDQDEDLDANDPFDLKPNQDSLMTGEPDLED